MSGLCLSVGAILGLGGIIWIAWDRDATRGPGLMIIGALVAILIGWVSAPARALDAKHYAPGYGPDVRVVVRDCCSTVAWVTGHMFTLDDEHAFYVEQSGDYGRALVVSEKPFVSMHCEGELCSFEGCSAKAKHKVEETIFGDDPLPHRHELTAYVCHTHFRLIMGPAADRQSARKAPLPRIHAKEGDMS